MSETASRPNPEGLKKPSSSLQSKEVVSVSPEALAKAEYVAQFADHLRDSADALGKKVAAGYEQEQSAWNFIAPGNTFGFSTFINDGKTFSGIRLETLVASHESAVLASGGARLLSRLLQSGKTIEEASKMPMVQKFLDLPEGKLLVAYLDGVDQKTAEAKFYLDKARFLKALGSSGDVLAEAYYRKLEGTQYAKIATKESMSFGAKFHEEFRDFANNYLTADTILLTALAPGAGMVLAKVAANSARVLRATQVISTAVKALPKPIVMAAPGVHLIGRKEGEKLLVSAAKAAANLGIDLAKFTGICEAAKAVGGEDFAKAVAILLAVVPGASHWYAKEMASPSTIDFSWIRRIINSEGEAALQEKIAKWLIEKAALAKAVTVAGMESAKQWNLADGAKAIASASIQKAREAAVDASKKAKEIVDTLKAHFHDPEGATHDSRSPRLREIRGSFSLRVERDIVYLEWGMTDKAALRDSLLNFLNRNPKVSEIRFSPDTPSATKRMLAEILAENHPLLGILRIMPEGRVATVVFGGIKTINDKLSQQDADIILAKVMAKVETLMHERFGSEWHVRLTADYKKGIFALPSSSASKMPTAREMRETVLEVIREESLFISQLAKKYGKTPDEVRNIVSHCQVGIGEARVPYGADDLAKLDVARESQVQALRSLSSHPEGMSEYFSLQKSVLEKYEGTRFSYAGRSYPAVIEIDDMRQIHPLVSEVIRKPGGIGLVEPAELGEAAEKLASILNRELDYVAPTTNFREDFFEAHHIENAFRQWRINRVSLERTFKGALSKPAFYAATEGRAGMSGFIDIKAMAKENRAALEYVAKVLQGGAEVPRNFRLDALGSVTRRFIRGVREFETAFPGMKVTLGGDEVFFFMPGATQKDMANILEHARHMLSLEGFDLRVAARVGTASKRAFDSLDNETKISKIIEQFARAEKGSTPKFLRHIEVATEGFDSESIVRWLVEQRAVVERAIAMFEGMPNTPITIQLSWVRVRLVPVWDETMRIEAIQSQKRAL